jgi:hypothetical protein
VEAAVAERVRRDVADAHQRKAPDGPCAIERPLKCLSSP